MQLIKNKLCISDHNAKPKGSQLHRVVTIQKLYIKCISKIYIFEDILANEKIDTITIDNKTIDVLACSSEHLIKEITAPPMAEGMANTLDGMYLLFESGAAKYRSHSGKNPVENVYFTTIE